MTSRWTCCQSGLVNFSRRPSFFAFIFAAIGLRWSMISFCTSGWSGNRQAWYSASDDQSVCPLTESGKSPDMFDSPPNASFTLRKTTQSS